MSKKLNKWERLLLLAINELGANAYGYSIAKWLQDQKHGYFSIGFIYTTTTRFEEQGLVRSWYVEGSRERGWRPKKYFVLTELGKETLEEINE